MEDFTILIDRLRDMYRDGKNRNLMIHSYNDLWYVSATKGVKSIEPYMSWNGNTLELAIKNAMHELYLVNYNIEP